MTGPRVVIAEDTAILREGLAQLLADRGFEVSATVGDGDALLAAVAEHRPDVTVVDVRMPPTFTDEGLRAAITLRRDFPGTAVLVFSQYVETRYAAWLLAVSPWHVHLTRWAVPPALVPTLLTLTVLLLLRAVRRRSSRLFVLAVLVAALAVN